eukprot:TRINITY_DN9525_c0_g1_i1.p1 TRINITY_DN9525_c0_g1~~TRINITY_DN9525_c0_g1_i1.p1  ORF type:complete len:304 (+),score=47.00 TRINITY_DN9525_c0_g1_i1:28-912(+)
MLENALNNLMEEHNKSQYVNQSVETNETITDEPGGIFYAHPNAQQAQKIEMQNLLKNLMGTAKSDHQNPTFKLVFTTKKYTSPEENMWPQQRVLKRKNTDRFVKSSDISVEPFEEEYELPDLEEGQASVVSRKGQYKQKRRRMEQTSAHNEEDEDLKAIILNTWYKLQEDLLYKEFLSFQQSQLNSQSATGTSHTSHTPVSSTAQSASHGSDLPHDTSRGMQNADTDQATQSFAHPAQQHPQQRTRQSTQQSTQFYAQFYTPQSTQVYDHDAAELATQSYDSATAEKRANRRTN